MSLLRAGVLEPPPMVLGRRAWNDEHLDNARRVLRERTAGRRASSVHAN